MTKRFRVRETFSRRTLLLPVTAEAIELIKS